MRRGAPALSALPRVLLWWGLVAAVGLLVAGEEAVATDADAVDDGKGAAGHAEVDGEAGAAAVVAGRAGAGSSAQEDSGEDTGAGVGGPPAAGGGEAEAGSVGDDDSGAQDDDDDDDDGSASDEEDHSESGEAAAASVPPHPFVAFHENVHVTSDPTMRRVVLLVVLPLTAGLVFVGVRTYFPNLDVEEKVKKLKSKSPFKKGKGKDQGPPPRAWWEGGTLGDAAALPSATTDGHGTDARVVDMHDGGGAGGGRIALLDSYREEFMGVRSGDGVAVDAHPRGGAPAALFGVGAAVATTTTAGGAAKAAGQRKALHKRLWADTGDDGADDGDDDGDMDTADPAHAPAPRASSSAVVAALRSGGARAVDVGWRGVANAAAAIHDATRGSLADALRGVEVQEAARREWLVSVANEDWFTLVSERDAGRRKAAVRERRAIEAAETQARADVAQAEDHAHSAIATQWWRLYQTAVERSLLTEKESDIRYALVFEETAARRDISADEQELRLYAATCRQRAATEEGEDAARADIVREQQGGRRVIGQQSARAHLVVREAVRRGVLAEREGGAVVEAVGRHIAGVEVYARHAVAAAEAAAAVVLDEHHERLWFNHAEAAQRLHLGRGEAEERRYVNVRTMRVVVDGAVVRASADRKSKLVATLPMGTVVDVLEVNPAGRALLAHPEGWVSVQSQAGLAILEDVDAAADEDFARLSEMGDHARDRSIPASPASSATPRIGRGTGRLSPMNIVAGWGLGGGGAAAVVSPRSVAPQRTPDPPAPQPLAVTDIGTPLTITDGDGTCSPPSTTAASPPHRPLGSRRGSMFGAGAAARRNSLRSVPLAALVAGEDALPEAASSAAARRSAAAVDMDVDMDGDGWGGDDGQLSATGFCRRADSSRSMHGAFGSEAGSEEGRDGLGMTVTTVDDAAAAAAGTSLASAAPPSVASSAPSSAVLEDFREIVLTKADAAQKLGICFAPNSPLVLSSCVDGSAAAVNGLDCVVGHRLIKVNDTPVADRAAIAPFAKERSIHLVFSKNPDPGWNADTGVWAPSRTQQLTGKVTSTALTGFMGLKKAAAEAKKAAMSAAKDAQRAAKELQQTANQARGSAPASAASTPKASGAADGGAGSTSARPTPTAQAGGMRLPPKRGKAD